MQLNLKVKGCYKAQCFPAFLQNTENTDSRPPTHTQKKKKKTWFIVHWRKLWNLQERKRANLLTAAREHDGRSCCCWHCVCSVCSCRAKQPQISTQTHCDILALKWAYWWTAAGLTNTALFQSFQILGGKAEDSKVVPWPREVPLILRLQKSPEKVLLVRGTKLRML